jgi:uncharacterized coiled-coil protein SlyX
MLRKFITGRFSQQEQQQQEGAVAEPPSKPAAAPAAPAPAAPAPSGDRGANPLESPQLEAGFDSAFPVEDGEDNTPAPPPERKPAPAKPAPAAAPAKPAAGAKLAPAAPPAADPYALPKEVAESKDLKQVREFAYGQNKRAKALEAEKAALQTKFDEISATVPKTEAERAALAKKVETFQKQVESYEERIRLTDFKQSEKYKTEFEKPYVKAFQKAVADIEKCPLTYKDAENNDQTRQGTSSDLGYLLNLERRAARVEAQKHFPEDWQDIMAHYDKVVPLREASIESEANYKANWKTIEQENATKRATETTQIQEAWSAVNKDLAEKHPEFSPRDGDAEGNKLLESELKTADLFFTDARQKLSVKDRVILDATMRNRFAAHKRLVRDVAAKDATIAELNATIAELRGSTPGAPKAVGGESKGGEESEGAVSSFDKKF